MGRSWENWQENLLTKNGGGGLGTQPLPLRGEKADSSAPLVILGGSARDGPAQITEEPPGWLDVLPSTKMR